MNNLLHLGSSRICFEAIVVILKIIFNLIIYLFVCDMSLQAVFATDLQSRSFLQLPKPVGVDFRASYVLLLLVYSHLIYTLMRFILTFST